MTDRSPARAPSTLLHLAGSRDAPAAVESTPAAPPKPTIAMPRWLGKDAKDVWRQIVPLMIEMELATEVDVVSLGVLCDQVGRWRMLARTVRKDGPSMVVQVTKDRTETRSNPAARELAKLDAQIMRSLGEFGLTPASRSRMRASESRGAELGALASLILDANGKDPRGRKPAGYPALAS